MNSCSEVLLQRLRRSINFNGRVWGRKFFKQSWLGAAPLHGTLLNRLHNFYQTRLRALTIVCPPPQSPMNMPTHIHAWDPSMADWRDHTAVQKSHARAPTIQFLTSLPRQARVSWSTLPGALSPQPYKPPTAQPNSHPATKIN